MLILIEWIIVAALLLAALAHPIPVDAVFSRFEKAFSRIANRRALALTLVAFTALAVRLAVLPVMPILAPTVDDEFSYLLQADTFLHGRLTNPTPALWTHFETFHVNMVPTYQSKYPPAQGAVLALGTLLSGRPIVGVWLSMAAMCAAICWMLQEWISPGWALLGGLLVAIRLSPFSYWSNSYWGGTVPAIAGALLLGGLARVRNSQRVRDATWMGLGVAILAASRPYEGLLVCLPVGGSLALWWMTKRTPDFQRVLVRTIVPLAACVVLAGVMLAYYNHRVTGYAWLLPYQVNHAAYDIAPLFIFQKPLPAPVYRQPVLREFQLLWAMPQYQETQSLRGLLSTWYEHFHSSWLVLLGPLFTLPLVLAPLIAMFEHRWNLRWPPWDWRAHLLLWTILISAAGLAIEVYGQPHYAAPVYPAVVVIVLLAMRRIRSWRFRGKPSGVFLSRAIPAACLLMFLLRAGSGPLHIDADSDQFTWYASDVKQIPRTDYQKMLEALPGRHLVIVTYNAVGNIDTPHEWVYNEADIDSSKIVWAWDMGAAENQKLIDYYRDRQVWRVTSQPPDDDAATRPGNVASVSASR